MDLNRKVHEALGHKIKQSEYNFVYGDYEPAIPDYTGDPRLWWPLLEEMMRDISSSVSLWWDGGYIICDWDKDTKSDRYRLQHKDIGEAVCEAWLKHKGVI